MHSYPRMLFPSLYLFIVFRRALRICTFMLAPPLDNLRDTRFVKLGAVCMSKKLATKVIVLGKNKVKSGEDVSLKFKN